jgi:hypothetical protein
MEVTLVNGLLTAFAVLAGVAMALGPFIALALYLGLRGDRDRAREHAAAIAQLETRPAERAADHGAPAAA